MKMWRQLQKLSWSSRCVTVPSAQPWSSWRNDCVTVAALREHSSEAFRQSALNKRLQSRVAPFVVGMKLDSDAEAQLRHYGVNTFQHHENMNAVQLLENLPNYRGTLFEYDDTVARGGELQSVEGSSQMSPVGRVKARSTVPFRNSVLDFIEAAYTSQEMQLPVTHPKNEDIVKHVLLDLKGFTDGELCQVLYHFRLFAPCPSSKDPPYMKIWKELDQECHTRSASWSLDFSFVVADLWYGISLARLSNFHWTLVKRLFRRCDKLKKEHFVRFMFCLNVNRELPPNAEGNGYILEHNLYRIQNELTAEEIVVIAMAFFKTQIKIKDPVLVKKLLETVMKSASSLDPISIAAVAKIARYSTDISSAQVIYDFQKAFLPELPRLSLSACTHLALAATNSLSPYKELVQCTVERIRNNIPEARLKELERILLAATMFNVDCKQLCNDVALELQKQERADEIRKYGRCLPAILHYLTIGNVFAPELISTCLSKTFRYTYYGRDKEIFQRELLCLDVAAGIEIPDYNGSRLEEKTFNLIMKRNMLWIKPPSKLRVSLYERFTRSVTEVMHTIFQDKNLFHVVGILPQHHTLMMVFCRDKEGKNVAVPQYYYEISPYQIKKIQPNSDVNYHAVVLLGRSQYLNNERDLTGQANLQVRQTEKLGYTTHLVFYRDWELLEDLNARRQHLENILN